MSPGRSPSNADVVDALLLAARGATLERSFALAELPRLAELANESVQPSLTARFHMVDARVGIAGTVNGTLALKCQRCLQRILVPVVDEFHVVLVPSEVEMEQLPEQQDAIVADATRLDLAWLVEEQLLLAMPLVPTHADTTECERAEVSLPEVALPIESIDESQIESAAVEAKDAPQRPFANLRELLNANAPKASGKKSR